MWDADPYFTLEVMVPSQRCHCIQKILMEYTVLIPQSLFVVGVAILAMDTQILS